MEFALQMVGPRGPPFSHLFQFTTVALDYLHISVPPKLHSILSKDAFNVGDRVTLTCTVTAGDEPMTLKWLKNGQELNSRYFSNLNPFTSVLMVENLSQEHHGNYTCVARNDAAAASETAQLVVNGRICARGTPGLPTERFLSLSAR